MSIVGCHEYAFVIRNLEFCSNSLLQSCDVCLIQEHWLLHEQLSLLSVNVFLSSGVSGMTSFTVVLLVTVPSYSEDLFSLLYLVLTTSSNGFVQFCCVIGVAPQPF